MSIVVVVTIIGIRAWQSVDWTTVKWIGFPTRPFPFPKQFKCLENFSHIQWIYLAKKSKGLPVVSRYVNYSVFVILYFSWLIMCTQCMLSICVVFTLGTIYG